MYATDRPKTTWVWPAANQTYPYYPALATLEAMARTSPTLAVNAAPAAAPVAPKATAATTLTTKATAGLGTYIEPYDAAYDNRSPSLALYQNRTPWMWGEGAPVAELERRERVLFPVQSPAPTQSQPAKRTKSPKVKKTTAVKVKSEPEIVVMAKEPPKQQFTAATNTMTAPPPSPPPPPQPEQKRKQWKDSLRDSVASRSSAGTEPRSRFWSDPPHRAEQPQQAYQDPYGRPPFVLDFRDTVKPAPRRDVRSVERSMSPPTMTPPPETFAEQAPPARIYQDEVPPLFPSGTFPSQSQPVDQAPLTGDGDDDLIPEYEGIRVVQRNLRLSEMPPAQETAARRLHKGNWMSEHNDVLEHIRMDRVSRGGHKDAEIFIPEKSPRDMLAVECPLCRRNVVVNFLEKHIEQCRLVNPKQPPPLPPSKATMPEPPASGPTVTPPPALFHERAHVQLAPEDPMAKSMLPILPSSPSQIQKLLRRGMLESDVADLLRRDPDLILNTPPQARQFASRRQLPVAPLPAKDSPVRFAPPQRSLTPTGQGAHQPSYQPVGGVEAMYSGSLSPSQRSDERPASAPLPEHPAATGTADPGPGLRLLGGNLKDALPDIEALIDFVDRIRNGRNRRTEAAATEDARARSVSPPSYGDRYLHSSVPAAAYGPSSHYRSAPAPPPRYSETELFDRLDRRLGGSGSPTAVAQLSTTSVPSQINMADTFAQRVSPPLPPTVPTPMSGPTPLTAQPQPTPSVQIGKDDSGEDERLIVFQNSEARTKMGPKGVPFQHVPRETMADAQWRVAAEATTGTTSHTLRYSPVEDESVPRPASGPPPQPIEPAPVNPEDLPPSLQQQRNADVCPFSPEDVVIHPLTPVVMDADDEGEEPSPYLHRPIPVRQPQPAAAPTAVPPQQTQPQVSLGQSVLPQPSAQPQPRWQPQLPEEADDDEEYEEEYEGEGMDDEGAYEGEFEEEEEEEEAEDESPVVQQRGSGGNQVRVVESYRDFEPEPVQTQAALPSAVAWLQRLNAQQHPAGRTTVIRIKPTTAATDATRAGGASGPLQPRESNLEPKPVVPSRDCREVKCQYCGNNIFEDRMLVHTKICLKRHQQSLQDTRLPNRDKLTQVSAAPEATKPKATVDSEAAVRAALAAKKAAMEVAGEDNVANGATTKAQCGSCGRWFAADALRRHGAICRRLADHQ